MHSCTNKAMKETNKIAVCVVLTQHRAEEWQRSPAGKEFPIFAVASGE